MFVQIGFSFETNNNNNNKNGQQNETISNWHYKWIDAGAAATCWQISWRPKAIIFDCGTFCVLWLPRISHLRTKPYRAEPNHTLSIHIQAAGTSVVIFVARLAGSEAN